MAKIFVVFFACLMDLPCYNLYHVAVVGLRVLALSIVKTQINAFIYLPIYLLFLIYLKKKNHYSYRVTDRGTDDVQNF